MINGLSPKFGSALAEFHAQQIQASGIGGEEEEGDGAEAKASVTTGQHTYDSHKAWLLSTQLDETIILCAGDRVTVRLNDLKKDV